MIISFSIMGNAISPCCCHSESTSSVQLIFYGGDTRTLTGKRTLAGEIMFEFPDQMVCHGDSFFIGHPIPALAIDDELTKGQTYFVLPITCFTRNVLSVSCVAALGSKQDGPKQTAINSKDCPFEYLKGSDGRVLIKVRPQFIMKLLGSEEEEEIVGNDLNNSLCSTPELQKQYDLLVGCNKDHLWSPNLETISEYKFRYSPFRFLGMERKQKEMED